MDSAVQESIRGPVIVVSDIHLGSCDSNYGDFRDFLFFLNDIGVEGNPVKGSNLKICKPNTIILLGDILEFWKPAGSDRNYIIECVLPPLSALCKLNCDIIYVTGNHDEDLWDIKRIWGKVDEECEHKGKKEKEYEGVKFPYNGKSTIEIYERTYPERSDASQDKIEGVKIGSKCSKKYVFMHGHQFDPIQITYSISRKIEKGMIKYIIPTLRRLRIEIKEASYRFDPIDYLQDLANSSFSKRVGKRTMETVIFSFVTVLWMVLGIIIYLRDVLVLSVIGIAWMLISTFILVTVIPRCLSHIFPLAWSCISKYKIKYKCVNQILLEHYEDKKGQYINADVIIFGHTHNPGEHKWQNKKTQKNQLFVNTGCWVNEIGSDINSFVYIDDESHHLLKWDRASKNINVCINNTNKKERQTSASEDGHRRSV